MEPAASSNPLLASDGPNKLKLGVFAFNGAGVAFTKHPDQRSRPWAEHVEIAQRADRLGLEALVSFARWLPLGGVGSRTGHILDPIAWTSAMTAVTENIAVIATIHTFALNPVQVAKAIATIDQIGGGRTGINVVVGWNQAEAALFSSGLNEHDDRYVLSQEWLEIIEKLWTSDEKFDYKGEYFDVKGAITDPQPVGSRPVIMNAGNSARGREFAAANADMAFVLMQDRAPEAIKAQVEAYRQLARERYGREIQVWAHSFVVQRPSVDEAMGYVQEYAVEQGDIAAADEFISGAMGIPLESLPPETLQGMRFGVNAGAFGFPLVGSAEDIAGSLGMLSDAGVDGVLLTWLDYSAGLAEFAETVLPLLEGKGLRVAAQ